MSRPNLQKPEHVGGALAIYTIYEDPTDYPGMFVVRASYVGGNVPSGKVLNADKCTVHKTLCSARNDIPIGFVFSQPHPGDDPCIREVWI